MKNAQKTLNNKTIAAALVAAFGAQHLTVSGFKSGLKKYPAAAPANKGKPAASAMENVVATAGDKTTAAKGKPENYSAEVTAKLLADYEASDKSDGAIKTLADALGKTTRSIVAKLSREGVYKKKVYTTKQGGVPVSKEQHVQAIAAFIGVGPDKLESLEKANKGVLVIIEGAVKDGAATYEANNMDNAEGKAKQELLTDLYGLTGAEDGSLKSLLLASKEALQVLVAAFADSGEAFAEQAEQQAA
jgi:hypothetical protein